MPDDLSPGEAAARFAAQYPRARLDRIDAQFVRGPCQDCGRPVMEHDSGYSYDGHYRCATCTAQYEESL